MIKKLIEAGLNVEKRWDAADIDYFVIFINSLSDAKKFEEITGHPTVVGGVWVLCKGLLDVTNYARL